MGKEYARQVDASVRLVLDSVVNEFVNRVGQSVVRNSDARVPFIIKVIDSEASSNGMGARLAMIQPIGG